MQHFQNVNFYKVIKDSLKFIPYSEHHALLLAGPAKLPVQIEGKTILVNWYTWTKVPFDFNFEQFTFNPDLQYSSLLAFGNFSESESSLVRFHSICHTGDIFHSQRCDCGYQLETSMKLIHRYDSGAIFYLSNHEGRGIGLFHKNLAYILQENGLDTIEANHMLDLEDDYRCYEESAAILKYLRSKPISVLTNNPKKVQALKECELPIDAVIPLWGQKNAHNQKYIETKIHKNGHYVYS